MRGGVGALHDTQPHLVTSKSISQLSSNMLSPGHIRDTYYSPFLGERDLKRLCLDGIWDLGEKRLSAARERIPPPPCPSFEFEGLIFIYSIGEGVEEVSGLISSRLPLQLPLDLDSLKDLPRGGSLGGLAWVRVGGRGRPGIPCLLRSIIVIGLRRSGNWIWRLVERKRWASWIIGTLDKCGLWVVSEKVPSAAFLRGRRRLSAPPPPHHFFLKKGSTRESKSRIILTELESRSVGWSGI